MEKKNPGKIVQPVFDFPEKQNYNELLSYDKMREMAAEYVKGKRNV